MNYKIKDEWMNKTIKVYSKHTGTRAMSTSKIDLTKIEYYFSIGLKHIFEEVVTTTAPEVVVIEYKAIEGPIPESTPKPKKKRKPKGDAQA
jgi:hypothetical protein